MTTTRHWLIVTRDPDPNFDDIDLDVIHEGCPSKVTICSAGEVGDGDQNTEYTEHLCQVQAEIDAVGLSGALGDSEVDVEQLRPGRYEIEAWNTCHPAVPGLHGTEWDGGLRIVDPPEGGERRAPCRAQDIASEVREYADQVAAAVTVTVGCPVSVVVHPGGHWANLVIEAEPSDDIHLPSAEPGRLATLIWICPSPAADPVGWSWDMSTIAAPTASLEPLLAADGTGLGPDAAPDEVAAAVAAANNRKGHP